MNRRDAVLQKTNPKEKCSYIATKNIGIDQVDFGITDGLILVKPEALEKYF